MNDADRDPPAMNVQLVKSFELKLTVTRPRLANPFKIGDQVIVEKCIGQFLEGSRGNVCGLQGDYCIVTWTFASLEVVIDPFTQWKVPHQHLALDNFPPNPPVLKLVQKNRAAEEEGEEGGTDIASGISSFRGNISDGDTQGNSIIHACAIANDAFLLNQFLLLMSAEAEIPKGPPLFELDDNLGEATGDFEIHLGKPENEDLSSLEKVAYFCGVEFSSEQSQKVEKVFDGGRVDRDWNKSHAPDLWLCPGDIILSTQSFDRHICMSVLYGNRSEWSVKLPEGWESVPTETGKFLSHSVQKGKKEAIIKIGKDSYVVDLLTFWITNTATGKQSQLQPPIEIHEPRRNLDPSSIFQVFCGGRWQDLPPFHCESIKKHRDKQESVFSFYKGAEHYAIDLSCFYQVNIRTQKVRPIRHALNGCKFEVLLSDCSSKNFVFTQEPYPHFCPDFIRSQYLQGKIHEQDFVTGINGVDTKICPSTDFSTFEKPVKLNIYRPGATDQELLAEGRISRKEFSKKWKVKDPLGWSASEVAFVLDRNGLTAESEFCTQNSCDWEEIRKAAVNRSSPILSEALKLIVSKYNSLFNYWYNAALGLVSGLQELFLGSINERGETPLALAVKRGNVNAVQLLLRYKAEVNISVPYRKDEWISGWERLPLSVVDGLKGGRSRVEGSQGKVMARGGNVRNNNFL